MWNSQTKRTNPPSPLFREIKKLKKPRPFWIIGFQNSEAFDSSQVGPKKKLSTNTRPERPNHSIKALLKHSDINKSRSSKHTYELPGQFPVQLLSGNYVWLTEWVYIMSLIKLGRGDILHKILNISNFFFFAAVLQIFFENIHILEVNWFLRWRPLDENFLEVRKKTQKRKIPKKSPLPIAVIFSPSFGVPGRVEAKLQTGYPKNSPSRTP